jgi:hypothetical protein
MPKHLSLPTELVNAILQYLGTKPFQETHQLINAIQAECTPQIQEAQQTMEVGGTD